MLGYHFELVSEYRVVFSVSVSLSVSVKSLIVKCFFFKIMIHSRDSLRVATNRRIKQHQMISDCAGI